MGFAVVFFLSRIALGWYEKARWWFQAEDYLRTGRAHSVAAFRFFQANLRARFLRRYKSLASMSTAVRLHCPNSVKCLLDVQDCGYGDSQTIIRW
jgi:hypothetical protein